MPELKHLSYSALTDFVKCPYYFKLKKIDKIELDEQTPHLSFGKALHTICEGKTEQKINKTEKEWEYYFDSEFLKEIKELKNVKLSDYADMVMEMREQGKYIIPHILPALKEYFGEYEFIKAEEFFYLPIDFIETKLKFKGFIDLIIKTKKDNKYHIIDWKTCSWGWEPRQKGDKLKTYQLTLYKYFFSKKYNIPLENIETHFGLLKRTNMKNRVELFRVTSGDRKITNALLFLGEIVQNVENKRFNKNLVTCNNCGMNGKECPYNNTKYCVKNR